MWIFHATALVSVLILSNTILGFLSFNVSYHVFHKNVLPFSFPIFNSFILSLVLLLWVGLSILLQNNKKWLGMFWMYLILRLQYHISIVLNIFCLYIICWGHFRIRINNLDCFKEDVNKDTFVFIRYGSYPFKSVPLSVTSR